MANEPLTMADAYAAAQQEEEGDPGVIVPHGVQTSVVIHVFDDGSFFVGSNVIGIDDADMIEAIAAAADLFGVGPSGQQEPCTLHTVLDRFCKPVSA